MLTRLTLICGCLAIVLAAAGCDDDDGGDETPSVTASPVTSMTAVSVTVTNPSPTPTTASSPAVSPTSPSTPTATATSTGFTPIGTNPSTGLQTVPGSGIEQATAGALRIAAHAEGWDRIVIEFRDGALPPASVDYMTEVIACGSGEVLDPRAPAILVVTMTNAVAHDQQGQPTVTLPSTVGDVVRSAVDVCDYEGVVSYAFGLTEERPFVVGTLQDPPRLVIDIQH